MPMLKRFLRYKATRFDGSSLRGLHSARQTVHALSLGCRRAVYIKFQRDLRRRVSQQFAQYLISHAVFQIVGIHVLIFSPHGNKEVNKWTL